MAKLVIEISFEPLSDALEAGANSGFQEPLWYIGAGIDNGARVRIGNRAAQRDSDVKLLTVIP